MVELYKKGSQGEMVKQIQKALNLYPDGYFGPLTEERVRQWQNENGLRADGIVGPATLAKLFKPVV
jgi:peptidoglycan hydrolase-like protein with peptidoglycan-binding domain